MVSGNVPVDMDAQKNLNLWTEMETLQSKMKILILSLFLIIPLQANSFHDLAEEYRQEANRLRKIEAALKKQEEYTAHFNTPEGKAFLAEVLQRRLVTYLDDERYLKLLDSVYWQSRINTLNKHLFNKKESSIFWKEFDLQMEELLKPEKEKIRLKKQREETERKLDAIQGIKN